MGVEMIAKRFLVEPGSHISLDKYDSADTRDLRKTESKDELVAVNERLGILQEQFYAAGKYALLIILQGMDTSGKDGVIKNGLAGLNPQGCQVTSFKVPTSEELAHDFLWRIHKAVPPRSMVGIFNRSHYEDVLVVRVENLVPAAIWKKRYDAINQFEKLLSDNGVITLKFFLHISKDEQRKRLEDRLANPQDHWKFRVSDLQTRDKWDEYMAAYEDVLTKCSTDYAPWYIIPSDSKWYRNLMIAKIVAETLESLELDWPPLEQEAKGIKIV